MGLKFVFAGFLIAVLGAILASVEFPGIAPTLVYIGFVFFIIGFAFEPLLWFIRKLLDKFRG